MPKATYHKEVIKDLDEKPVVSEYATQSLARYVVKAVKKCFEKEENRKAFEQWYFEKYGKKYEWKTRSVNT